MAKVTDVVVVGGGINGLSLAFHLARKGAGRVMVLERAQLGAGASGKSGGMVRAHYTDEAEARLALEGLRFFERWDDEVGGNCGFSQVGLVVIVPPPRLPELQRSVDLHRLLGIDSRLITAREARELDPALRLPEGISHVVYEPGAGYVEPNLAIRTLAAAALRLGVTIHTEVEVEAVLHARGRVNGVLTGAGIVSAPNVVLAAGARTNELLGGLGVDLGLRPAVARVAVFPAPPERSWPHPTYLDNAQRSWYRPVAGAATLVGVESAVARRPRLEDGTETIDPGFVGTAADVIAERFPVMRAAGSRGSWAGAFMESSDSRPVIGPLAQYEGLFAIAGDSGTSFKTAPAIGRGLAEMILTGASRGVNLASFSPGRFATGAPEWRGGGYTPEPASVSR